MAVDIFTEIRAKFFICLFLLFIYLFLGLQNNPYVSMGLEKYDSFHSVSPIQLIGILQITVNFNSLHQYAHSFLVLLGGGEGISDIRAQATNHQIACGRTLYP